MVETGCFYLSYLNSVFRLKTPMSDVLQQLCTPIDPKSFITQFEKKFTNWGKITKELKETWEQNCLVLNNVIAQKDTALKYIVSAPTGSAKTENTITYCAMLPKSIKVLISTNLIDETDRLVNDINKEANETRACSFHSKNDITLHKAASYQIVVVTHAFYKKHFAGDKQWDKLAENRDLIIIDEALDTMRESSLTTSEVNIAFNLFEILFMEKEYADNQSFYRELSTIVNDLDEMNAILEQYESGTTLVRSDTKIDIAEEGTPPCEITLFKFRKYFLFRKLLSSNKIKFNKLLTGVDDESNDYLIGNNILATIVKLDDFADRQVYITANKGEYSFNRVVDFTPKQSLVCFDATADVNSIYDIRQEHHGDIVKVPRIKGVRNYSNVNLHVVVLKTSKEAITSEIANMILANVSLGDKTLVVTHKSNEKHFASLATNQYKEKDIDVAHWGAITGLNKWQDCDTCVIAGLNHKPHAYTQNRTLMSTNEIIAFGSEQNNLNQKIETSNLVTEIIQAMNRIRIRKVSDTSGGCDTANIYLTLPSRDNSTYLHLIKEHMPNINILNWEIPDNIGGVVVSFGNVVAYLQKNLKVGDKIKITTPREALGINRETYRNITGKSQEQKQEFKDKANQLGFDIVEIHEFDDRGRSRTRPTKYIQRIT